jgi:hypothetical protein
VLIDFKRRRWRRSRALSPFFDLRFLATGWELVGVVVKGTVCVG